MTTISPLANSKSPDLHYSPNNEYQITTTSLVEHLNIYAPEVLNGETFASIDIHPNGERVLLVNQRVLVYNTTAFYAKYLRQAPFSTSCTTILETKDEPTVARYSPCGFFIAVGCSDGTVSIHYQVSVSTSYPPIQAAMGTKYPPSTRQTPQLPVRLHRSVNGSDIIAQGDKDTNSLNTTATSTPAAATTTTTTTANITANITANTTTTSTATTPAINNDTNPAKTNQGTGNIETSTDLEAWSVAYTFRPSTSVISELSWSPDSTKLIIGSTDNRVSVWSIPQPTIDTQTGFILSLSPWSLNNNNNNNNNNIHVNPINGDLSSSILEQLQNDQNRDPQQQGQISKIPELICVCEGHKTWVVGVAYDPLGEYLATLDLYGTVIIWRWNQDSNTHHPSNHQNNDHNEKNKGYFKIFKILQANRIYDSNHNLLSIENTIKYLTAISDLNTSERKQAGRIHFSPDGTSLVVVNGRNVVLTEQQHLAEQMGLFPTMHQCYISLEFLRDSFRTRRQILNGYSPSTAVRFNPRIFTSPIKSIQDLDRINNTQMGGNLNECSIVNNTQPRVVIPTIGLKPGDNSVIEYIPTVLNHNSPNNHSSATQSLSPPPLSPPPQSTQPTSSTPNTSSSASLSCYSIFAIGSIDGTVVIWSHSEQNPILIIPAIDHHIEDPLKNNNNQSNPNNNDSDTEVDGGIGKEKDGGNTIHYNNNNYQNPNHTPPKVSSVTDLRWSNDGYTLYISYSVGTVLIVRFGLFDLGMIATDIEIRNKLILENIKFNESSHFHPNFASLSNNRRILHNSSSSTLSTTLNTPQKVQNNPNAGIINTDNIFIDSHLPILMVNEGGIIGTGLGNLVNSFLHSFMLEYISSDRAKHCAEAEGSGYEPIMLTEIKHDVLQNSGSNLGQIVKYFIDPDSNQNVFSYDLSIKNNTNYSLLEKYISIIATYINTTLQSILYPDQFAPTNAFLGNASSHPTQANPTTKKSLPHHQIIIPQNLSLNAAQLTQITKALINIRSNRRGITIAFDSAVYYENHVVLLGTSTPETHPEYKLRLSYWKNYIPHKLSQLEEVNQLMVVRRKGNATGGATGAVRVIEMKNGDDDGHGDDRNRIGSGFGQNDFNTGRNREIDSKSMNDLDNDDIKHTIQVCNSNNNTKQLTLLAKQRNKTLNRIKRVLHQGSLQNTTQNNSRSVQKINKPMTVLTNSAGRTFLRHSLNPLCYNIIHNTISKNTNTMAHRKKDSLSSLQEDEANASLFLLSSTSLTARSPKQPHGDNSPDLIETLTSWFKQGGVDNSITSLLPNVTQSTPIDSRKGVINRTITSNNWTQFIPALTVFDKSNSIHDMDNIDESPSSSGMDNLLLGGNDTDDEMPSVPHVLSLAQLIAIGQEEEGEGEGEGENRSLNPSPTSGSSFQKNEPLGTKIVASPTTQAPPNAQLLSSQITSQSPSPLIPPKSLSFQVNTQTLTFTPLSISPLLQHQSTLSSPYQYLRVTLLNHKNGTTLSVSLSDSIVFLQQFKYHVLTAIVSGDFLIIILTDPDKKPPSHGTQSVQFDDYVRDMYYLVILDLITFVSSSLFLLPFSPLTLLLPQYDEIRSNSLHSIDGGGDSDNEDDGVLSQNSILIVPNEEEDTQSKNKMNKTVEKFEQQSSSCCLIFTNGISWVFNTRQNDHSFGSIPTVIEFSSLFSTPNLFHKNVQFENNLSFTGLVSPIASPKLVSPPDTNMIDSTTLPLHPIPSQNTPSDILHINFNGNQYQIFAKDVINLNSLPIQISQVILPSLPNKKQLSSTTNSTPVPSKASLSTPFFLLSLQQLWVILDQCGQNPDNFSILSIFGFLARILDQLSEHEFLLLTNRSQQSMLITGLPDHGTTGGFDQVGMMGKGQHGLNKNITLREQFKTALPIKILFDCFRSTAVSLENILLSQLTWVRVQDQDNEFSQQNYHHGFFFASSNAQIVSDSIQKSSTQSKTQLSQQQHQQQQQQHQQQHYLLSSIPVALRQAIQAICTCFKKQFAYIAAGFFQPIQINPNTNLDNTANDSNQNVQSQYPNTPATTSFAQQLVFVFTSLLQMVINQHIQHVQALLLTYVNQAKKNQHNSSSPMGTTPQQTYQDQQAIVVITHLLSVVVPLLINIANTSSQLGLLIATNNDTIPLTGTISPTNSLFIPIVTQLDSFINSIMVKVVLLLTVFKFVRRGEKNNPNCGSNSSILKQIITFSNDQTDEQEFNRIQLGQGESNMIKQLLSPLCTHNGLLSPHLETLLKDVLAE
jgi:hypothetical protein